MKRKTLRLYLLLLSLGGVALAAGLAANAIFGNTLVFFYAPGELAKAEIAPDARIRIGGLVEAGSLHPGNDPAEISFRVTDLTAAIEVRYRGPLPDLFREGQGVVAEGRLDPAGFFAAETILAKHDENYMPPEIAEALKKSGRWQEGASANPP